MHGGAKGSGGPRGERNGNYKHGLWTLEEVQARATARARMRGIRAYLKGRSVGGLEVHHLHPRAWVAEAPEAPFGSGLPSGPPGGKGRGSAPE